MNGPIAVSVASHACLRGSVPIPMALRVFVQRSEHDRQNNFNIVADEVAKVLVVPEVERAFGDLRQWLAAVKGSKEECANLEMGTGH